MNNLSSTIRSLKHSLKEELLRLGTKISAMIVGAVIDPRLGLALSIVTTSIIGLRKLGVFIKKRRLSEHMEDLKTEIPMLEKEYEDRIKEKEYQETTLRETKDELKRILIKNRVEAIMLELKNIIDRRCYDESLLCALKFIESLRYKYGEEVDKVYEKTIELSIKASEGKLKDEEVNEIIEKIKDLMDKQSDFPSVLLMIAKEELS